MARSLPEWRGRTDDSRPPPRVRARIFEREQGLCHICRLKIQTGQKWEMDHKIALINGGRNAEFNMAPAHKACHVGKSRADVKEARKVQRTRGKHVGAVEPKRGIPSPPKAEKPAGKTPLAPRRLYKEKSK